MGVNFPMKTVTIQIGNTDNKLTQQGWAEFVERTRGYLEYYVEEHLADMHFSASSEGSQPWQNAAFVLAFATERLTRLRSDLSALAATYSQDSIALTVAMSATAVVLLVLFATAVGAVVGWMVRDWKDLP